MSNRPKVVHIIGAGLAGVEASWQCLKADIPVILYEMRPKRMTEAHKTGDFAELVCSNSLKSMNPNSATGLLKAEMEMFDSLVMKAAHASKVEAGDALAVERRVFSSFIKEHLISNKNFSYVEKEIEDIIVEASSAPDDVWIIASGPLTSGKLVDSICKLSGKSDRLYFYDAIAPTIDSDSIDFDYAFWQDRHKEGYDGSYLNIPLNKEEYLEFVNDLNSAEKVPLHSFEKVNYFESCLPIEVMAERGIDTLRFGPMKPIGIKDPKTGKTPYANIQLRLENKGRTMLSMVGFQTKMKWGEQKRVFSKLKALSNVEFYRYGSIHRNTYLDSPHVLNSDLSFKNNPNIFLAGQITGVEGYLESAAMGIVSGYTAVSRLKDCSPQLPSELTLMGALLNHVTCQKGGKFQPMNANMGLLPTLKKVRGESKKERKERQCALAREEFENYFKKIFSEEEG